MELSVDRKNVLVIVKRVEELMETGLEDKEKCKELIVWLQRIAKRDRDTEEE